MSSSWIMQVGPKSNDMCSYKRKAEGDLRHKGTEVKARQRHRLPQKWRIYNPRNTKDCWQPQEARRAAQNRISLSPSRKNQPCQHLDSGWPPELRKKSTVVVLSCPHFGIICYESLRKPIKAPVYFFPKCVLIRLHERKDVQEGI